MNAQELRIGNYIHIIGENGDAKSSLSGRVVYVHEDEVRVHIRIENMINEQTGQLCDVEMVCVPPQSAIEPIPLTEELLLKCGFEEYYEEDIEENITDYCQKNGIVFSRRYGTIVDCVTHEKIHYLHQLQNLYFALTGEELDVKF